MLLFRLGIGLRGLCCRLGRLLFRGGWGCVSFVRGMGVVEGGGDDYLLEFWDGWCEWVVLGIDWFGSGVAA